MKLRNTLSKYAILLAVISLALVTLLPALAVHAMGAQGYAAAESAPIAVDVGKILTAVLIAILPPLAVAVMRWLWAEAGFLFERMKTYNGTLMDMLEAAAKFAVKAAEQAHLGEQIAEQYENKKAYALDMAERWLEAQGITGVDLDLLAAAIEKAVLEEFNPPLEVDESF